jgi:tRNA (guanine37-N1)-methyltransferase
MQTMHFVYILRCGDGSLYTGWTTNLLRRLSTHESGAGAKYTRGRGPLELAYSEVYPTKSEALQREAEIKALPRARKQILMSRWTAAQAWLGAAGSTYLDMCEMLRRGLADVVASNGDGVLLRLRTDDVYMLAANDENAAKRLLASAAPGLSVCAHGAHCAAAVEEVLGLQPEHTCRLMAYQSAAPVPPIPKGAPPIRKLGAEYGPMVAAEYHGMESADYALAQVVDGAVYGVFVDERPVGFIGTHTDGSMGMLEVLSPYRRQGLAELLERFALHRALAAGEVPFCYIAANNEPSLHLQEKLGLTVCGDDVYWMY